MASLHTLLTALIRLIGIYYVFKAVDIMLSALTYYGGLSNFDTNLQQTSIVYIIVQLIFAVLIFLIAPKLAT